MAVTGVNVGGDGTERPRGDVLLPITARHAAIAPYGPFPTGDGKTVYLGLQNDREWARFCADVLRQPDLARDPRFASNSARVAHQGELTALITHALARLTADEALEMLEAAGIASARMNTVDELLAHPQLAARGRWREVDSPAGRLRALAPPIGIDGAEPVMEAVPGVGEHTDAILRDIGIDEGTIAEWRTRHII